MLILFRPNIGSIPMRKIALLCLLAVSLPACGLKGALYLPQQKPAAAVPAPDSSADKVPEGNRNPPAPASK